jgi:hypothetical protein
MRLRWRSGDLFVQQALGHPAREQKPVQRALILGEQSVRTA